MGLWVQLSASRENGKEKDGRKKKKAILQEKMLHAMAVVSATQESGAGGLLQPMNLRPD